MHCNVFKCKEERLITDFVFQEYNSYQKTHRLISVKSANTMTT